MTNQPTFEFNRLVEYSDDAILEEIRRVAALVPNQAITKKLFDAHACVSASTVCKRFTSWKSALDRAGIAYRYGGQIVSDKMLNQKAKSMSNEEIIEEIQHVAIQLGKSSISYAEFNDQSKISYSAVLRRFGSWRSALEKAGLTVSNHGRRYSDDECFENLLSVWTLIGRAPQYKEMASPKSNVGGKAYIKRWGTWHKALSAFVDRVNNEADSVAPAIQNENIVPQLTITPPSPADRREIRLGLRYRVLKRDGFKCVVCGRSPAITAGVELHIDHIEPFSRGGKTVFNNLRTTCRECNLGKGAARE